MDLNKPKVYKITYKHEVFNHFGKIHLMAEALKRKLKKQGKSEREAEAAAVESIKENMKKLRQQIKTSKHNEGNND